MKKILAITLAATMLTATAASADGYNRRHQHRHYNGGGGNNWVAPLVGGLLIGGILAGGAYAAQPYPQGYYYAPPPPVYVPTCWRQPLYDYYGRQVGWQRVCQ